ncbi:MAG: T9SS type A sorting domain-containing protein [Ignavibacteria bacterium]
MKKFIFCLIFLFACLFNNTVLSQNQTSLTDIYMGNFGFWDYQSTGSLQYLEQDSANTSRYSAVYLTADSTINNPTRRVLYFYSSNGGNNWVSTTVANVNSFYPSLALQTDGRAIICFYDSANSKIRLYRNISSGSLTFDTLTSPPGSGGLNPKILFYRNYLILFAAFSSGGGQLQKNRYNFITNTWESWQPVGSNNGPSSYQIAKGWGGKIAVCWIGDSTFKRVKHSESLDSGNTFGVVNTIFTQEITGGDTVKALAHIDMVYYQNQLCIVWDAIARILPAGGQNGIRKFYHNPRIYFWNLANGIRLVADSSNYGGNSLPGRNFQISMGANWSTICGPSIGVSGSFLPQNIYIAYSAAKTNIPFGNFWYDSDIFIKFSNSGGTFWYNCPPFYTTDNQNDDRFVYLNKKNNVGFGYSYTFTVQKDKFPGSYRAGDTIAITRAYPEFFLIQVFIHTVNEFKEPFEFDLCPNYPNPFNAFTHIEYWLPKKAFVELIVYDLLGRKVETLVNEVSNVGSSHVVFRGDNYSSGVYIYRMYVDGEFIDARKMVLVK